MNIAKIITLFFFKESFVTLGKDEFMVKVKVEDEKHIYIIPDKHSYHPWSKFNCNGTSLEPITIELRSWTVGMFLGNTCAEYKVAPVNKIMLKN